MHQCINIFFYFGMTLYMFRTVFPSIIRSATLYIQPYIRSIILMFIVFQFRSNRPLFTTLKYDFSEVYYFNIILMLA